MESQRNHEFIGGSMCGDIIPVLSATRFYRVRCEMVIDAERLTESLSAVITHNYDEIYELEPGKRKYVYRRYEDVYGEE